MGLGYFINQKMVLVNSDQYLKGYHQTRVQQKVQNLMVSTALLVNLDFGPHTSHCRCQQVQQPNLYLMLRRKT